MTAGDRRTKGVPEVPARVVADLPTPALLLQDEALRHNLTAMAEWCAHHRVLLAPHGKTTMAPALFARQLALGAWGITVATVQQAAVALEAGAQRILIANELVTAADCRWIARTRADRPELTLAFCVDSLPGVELAAREARRAGGPPLEVLVEVGYVGGRCGARGVPDAVAIATAVARDPWLRLVGVEGYEGLIAGSAPLADVDAFLELMALAAERLAPLVEVDEPLLSAGGSAWFDRVVALLRPAADRLGWRLLLRSGCYATHDHGLYERLTPAGARGAEAPRFRGALELRASVLSVPEPGRAIVGFGRRDVSYDAGLPTVLGVGGADGRDAGRAGGLQVIALNDQHAFVEVSDGARLDVGDTVVCGISHPCTTVERWRAISLVGDRDRVLETLTTCF